MDVSAFRVKEGRSVRLKKWPTNVDRFYESDADYAAQLTTCANFGNIAMHAGKRVEYDVEQGVITYDKDANKFLSKEYRKGWELPV